MYVFIVKIDQTNLIKFALICKETAQIIMVKKTNQSLIKFDHIAFKCLKSVYPYFQKMSINVKNLTNTHIHLFPILVSINSKYLEMPRKLKISTSYFQTKNKNFLRKVNKI